MDMILEIGYLNITEIFSPGNPSCQIVPEVCMLLNKKTTRGCCGGSISYFDPENILRALILLSSIDKVQAERLKQMLNVKQICVVYPDGPVQRRKVF